MSELPTHDILEQLYHRIDELEAELRLVGSTIEHLERIVLNKRHHHLSLESDARWTAIAEEVRADLFAEHLQNPPPEDE